MSADPPPLEISPQAPGAVHRRALSFDVVEAARTLLGCTVTHGETAGVIVETEAYHETEPACHAYAGLTQRTRTLFGPPGCAYVYRSYGIHALLNVVVEPEGVGAAVLIRAIEPLAGIELMRARRGVQAETALGSGPGKLTQALGIDVALDGTSLLDGPVRLGPPPRGRAAARIVTGPRIGITKAADLRWRFCAGGNPHVSRPRPVELPSTTRPF